MFKIDYGGQVEVGLLQSTHSNNTLYIALPVALLSVVILGLACVPVSFPPNLPFSSHNRILLATSHQEQEGSEKLCGGR